MTESVERFLPWHQQQRTRVLNQFRSGKLPHALLIGGPEFVGKERFARALASFLLCRDPGEDAACGQCSTCHLFSAGTHPDFRLVQPEESKLIRIEQIRDLIDWVSQTAQMSGMKVAVLIPAEQMNNQSANALLKCLEEPSSRTLLVLVTSQPGRLLPTVRSRCQSVDLPIPNAGDVLPWLESIVGDNDAQTLLDMAGGAPLAVAHKLDEEYLERRAGFLSRVERLVEAAESPLETAAAIASMEVGEGLEIFQGILVDALKLNMTSDEKYIKNKDMTSLIKSISEALDQRRLMQMIERVSTERRAVQGPSNPNAQLLMEGLFIEFNGHFRRSETPICNL